MVVGVNMDPAAISVFKGVEEDEAIEVETNAVDDEDEDDEDEDEYEDEENVDDGGF